MVRKRAFGELELEVLKVVREKGEATVRDVHEEMGESNRYTTIMTVMNRLFEKGDLDRKKKGRQYLYWMAEKGGTSVMDLLGRLNNQLFQGNPSHMIQHLLESGPELSDEQLDEISDIVKKKKKSQQDTPTEE